MTNYIQQNDLEGVLIWISLLLIVGIVSILLYEILRHNPKYFKVYYTRLSNSNSNRLHPKGLFEWIYWVRAINCEILIIEYRYSSSKRNQC